MTGHISATGNGAGTAVVFKNCAPFIKCTNHINSDFAENLHIAMSKYNLMKCSDNYLDTSGS